MQNMRRAALGTDLSFLGEFTRKREAPQAV